MKLLAKRPNLTDSQVRELGRLAASPPPPLTRTWAKGPCSATIGSRRTCWSRRRSSPTAIKRMLRQDQKAFGNAARNAERLKKVGDLDAAKAKEISLSAAEAGYVFDKLAGAKGPTSDALNEAARRLNRGDKLDRIIPKLYEKILEAIKADPSIRDLAPGDDGPDMNDPGVKFLAGDDEVREAYADAIGTGQLPIARIAAPSNFYQALAVRFGESLGLRMVYLDSPVKFKGFIHPAHPGVIFLNSNLAGPQVVAFTLGHELFHAMRRHDPSLLRSLVATLDQQAIWRGIKKYVDLYRGMIADTARKMVVNPEELNEEGMAMLVGQAATDPIVLERILGQSPSVLTRFVRWIKRVLGISKENATAKELLKVIDQLQEKNPSWDPAKLPDPDDVRLWFNRRDPGRLQFLPENPTDDELLAALRKAKGQKLNRPDLSQQMETDEGRDVINAVDGVRNLAGEPDPRPDAVVDAAATARLADRAAFVKEVMDVADAGGILTDVQVLGVKRLIDGEALDAFKSDDAAKLLELGKLADARRRTGSEWGRAGRQMRDPLMSHADRVRGFIAEALVTPERTRPAPTPRPTVEPGIDGPSEPGVGGADVVDAPPADTIDVPTAEEVEVAGTAEPFDVDVAEPIDWKQHMALLKKIKAELTAQGFDLDNLTDKQLSDPATAAA
jgi:hypothetical protein